MKIENAKVMIRYFIEEHQFTVRTLAKKIGVSSSVIYRARRGEGCTMLVQQQLTELFCHLKMRDHLKDQHLEVTRCKKANKNQESHPLM